MKTLLVAFASLALVAGLSSMTMAAKEAPKEVTLTGSFTCGKCELSESKKCHNVLIVEADGKKTTYWLTQNKVSKSNHKHACQAVVEGVTVVGKVHEEDGKMVITASSITIPDKS